MALNRRTGYVMVSGDFCFGPSLLAIKDFCSGPSLLAISEGAMREDSSDRVRMSDHERM